MESFKQFLIDKRKEVVLGILIFLVATISFAMGYLMAKESNYANIIIEKVQNP